MAEYISRAKMFVGHDSGPLHIAGALDIPILGLYLPSEFKRTYPQGPKFGRYIVKNNPADLSPQELVDSAFAVLSDDPSNQGRS